MVEQTHVGSSGVKMSRYELLLLEKKMKQSFEKIPKIQKKAQKIQKKEQTNAENELNTFLNSSL